MGSEVIASDPTECLFSCLSMSRDKAFESATEGTVRAWPAQSCSSRCSATSSPTTSVPDAPAPSCSRATRPTSCWFVVGTICLEACLCWDSLNAASASATIICSSVCLGNFLMVIHSARPQAAGTTQNNPLKTISPKDQIPPSQLCNTISLLPQSLSRWKC